MLGKFSTTSRTIGTATELPPADRSKRLSKRCGEFVRPGNVATTTSTSSPAAMVAGAVMLKTMRNKADEVALKKIFLDVAQYIGQSLEASFDPE